jgi:hypothetical protein
MRVIYVNILMVEQKQNSPESATRITTNRDAIQVTSHPINNSVYRPLVYDCLYAVFFNNIGHWQQLGAGQVDADNNRQ